MPSAIAVAGETTPSIAEAEQRQLEQVRPELPADVDVLRVTRPAAGDDRDVVEPVSLPRLLAAPDLYVQVNAPLNAKNPGAVGSPGP